VACVVGYACGSELCASCLDRQLGALNIPLINKSSDEVTLLHFQPGEIDMHIINISSLCTCNSLLSVAVISVAVVADVLSHPHT
jgi:hypothetical protein